MAVRIYSKGHGLQVFRVKSNIELTRYFYMLAGGLMGTSLAIINPYLAIPGAVVGAIAGFFFHMWRQNKKVQTVLIEQSPKIAYQTLLNAIEHPRVSVDILAVQPNYLAVQLGDYIFEFVPKKIDKEKVIEMNVIRDENLIHQTRIHYSPDNKLVQYWRQWLESGKTSTEFDIDERNESNATIHVINS